MRAGQLRAIKSSFNSGFSTIHGGAIWAMSGSGEGRGEAATLVME